MDCSNFQAANATRSKNKSANLSSKGVFGCACRRGIPRLFLSMRYGERPSYYILLEMLTSFLSDDKMHQRCKAHSAIGAPEKDIGETRERREKEGEVVREVEESGQERAEGEVERERKSTPNGPGDVRLITARGKGRSKAPAKKRPLEKRHGSAGLEATSQSGSQQRVPLTNVRVEEYVVVPGVVRTQRRAPGPGSGEAPGPARPRVRRDSKGRQNRGFTPDPDRPRSRNQSYTSTAGSQRLAPEGPGPTRTGAQGQKPGPQISKRDPKLVRSREPTRVTTFTTATFTITFTTTTTFTTRLTTARPPERVAGAEARPADPLTGAAAGPEAGNRRDYQCRAPERVAGASAQSEREPAPSQVPTAKGEILIPRHRTQTSVPRSDRNPRPARPRHHDQSQTKEWNLICSRQGRPGLQSVGQPVRPRRRGRPLDFGVTEDGYSRFPE
ncbi:hypothetical protein BSL78_23349 [Apostichopus japonicus]|uniref:Uncharacterized protein n=1 Tax=Stichopus japonicus TaxID=307972 RepID=A0A2G8JVN7_STIJA|nr:hypothetical protein BSL78_23349 [Apostichopus japonicus]